MHDGPSQPISYQEGDEDGLLVVPPRPGGDVCPICRGINYGMQHRCDNCKQNAAALDGFVEPVTSISLYERPGRLRDWLTFYKSGDDTLADPSAVAAVAHIFKRFLQSNEPWLGELRVDFAVVVPSTTRPAPHPLTVVLGSSGRSPLDFKSPLRRTSAALGHNHPSREAFEVVTDVRGARILLLDDVYTSGARAQSAAYALRARGAEVAALCVLGRRYNPAYSARAAALFAEQQEVGYDWDIASRG